jgi:2-keto-4-pentenoate hydratase/2-oxohepta-3-ene-1,7-dioic acid hydratase in catechol pathway
MTLRLCRFRLKGTTVERYGLLREGGVAALREEEPYDDVETTGDTLGLEQIDLLAPVQPSKIVCVGRNYVGHAAELGNQMPSQPLLFLKPPSSVIGPDALIELPVQSKQVEYEGEIGVVIGRPARNLTEGDDPLDYILGITCVNDVTARDIQRNDIQFTRAKSFDTFCPTGPWVGKVAGLDELEVTTRVNGIPRQSGRASEMAFSIPFLVRYISHIMTLLPGDLIATGTPAGVGRLSEGDTVEVEVAGVGVLTNRVVKAPIGQ